MFIKGLRDVIVTFMAYIAVWVVLRIGVNKEVFNEDFYMFGGIFLLVLIVKEILIPILRDKRSK